MMLHCKRKTLKVEDLKLITYLQDDARVQADLYAEQQKAVIEVRKRCRETLV